MRALALAAVVLLGGCDEDEVATTRPPAAQAAPKRRTPTQVKDCRDACEQQQLVTGQADDAALRACRAGCAGSGSGGGVGGPHEVPRSISRAPSLSAPPPIRPIGSPAPNR